MKYYAVAEINVSDPSWVAPYLQNVTGMVERYGGRFLARSAAIEKLEGDRDAPQVSLLIEWPSKEAAMDFYESEEYQPYLESRKKGSTGDFMLVSGEDISGLARIG